MRDRRVLKKSHTRFLSPMDPPIPGLSVNMKWDGVGDRTGGSTPGAAAAACTEAEPCPVRMHCQTAVKCVRRRRAPEVGEHARRLYMYLQSRHSALAKALRAFGRVAGASVQSLSHRDQGQFFSTVFHRTPVAGLIPTPWHAALLYAG